MKLFLFSTILLIFNVGFSQKNNTEATQTLQKLNNKIKNSTGTKINCLITTKSNKGQIMDSKNFEIKMKGNAYLLKQDKTLILCDGNFVYNFDGDKSITKTSIEDGNQDLNPQKIFSGNYEKDFIVSVENKMGNLTKISLKPKDARKNIHKISIEIETNSYIIKNAIFYDKANNITILKVKKIDFNLNFNNNMFIFNKNNYPKNVEIFD